MIPISIPIVFPMISFWMLFFSWTAIQIKLIEFFAKTKINLEDTTPMFWASSIITPLMVTYLTYKDLL